MHRPGGDPDRRSPPLELELRVVGDEVLGGRLAHLARLDAADDLRREGAGQVRVLAEELVVASAVRRADQVQDRSPEHLGAPRRAAPRRAPRPSCVVEAAVEGGRRRDLGGQRGRGRLGEAVAAPDAGAAVGHPEVGDRQLRDALDVAADQGEVAAHAVVRVPVVEVLVVDGAVEDLLELLVQRHRVEQELGSLFRWESGVHPWQVLLRCGRLLGADGHPEGRGRQGECGECTDECSVHDYGPILV